MKRFLKAAGFVAFALVLGVVAFIGGISYLSWRSERQLNTIVSELPPGHTTFGCRHSSWAAHTNYHETANEMNIFDGTATHSANPDTTLYFFVHRGLPYRWVLVYTDSSSQTIRHAEWQHM